MTPASAPLVEPETDTEITLGTGKMLILFFGLVILCALFFGMGFTMGKNSVRSAPELVATPSGVRPSAANKTLTPAPEGQTTPPAAQQPPADSGSSGSNPSAQQTPAAPDQNGTQQQVPGSTQQPAPTGPGYFVQVAAVSKQEDADALVEALKGHQYAAFISSQPSDKLFHVQVGPFTDITDAEATRAKLVSDGYNPILKK
jgi:cell division septation protein DedD